jgi:hypothetical protein
MSLLQMLATAWGLSPREVQRVLGRGVPGFRREGRGHYRALGPITAGRLRRVRSLDPRLPVAVWISGERTLRSAARLCGERIVDGLAKSQPHMEEAGVVLLALETRMAVDYKAVRRDYYLGRQETAVAYDIYRSLIKAELLEAGAEPRFVEARNSIRRLMNDGVPLPLREESAKEMGISLRTHFSRYPRRLWQRARIAADVFIEVKGPVDVMLEAMEILAEQNLDSSEDSVAEELGYECAEILFRTFTREEFAEALAKFEGRAIAEAPREQGRVKDTGQPEHRIAILKERWEST